MSRILLIDDDVQINEVVRATLEMLGHTVSIAERAETALETFAVFHPDITLVDYMLPGCSGLDVMRALSQSSPASIQYLATGMADFALLKQAMDAGAFSMLSKPYRLADLVGLMETALLLDAALHAESPPTGAEVLRLEAGTPGQVAQQDIAALMAFARERDADPDVSGRRLPLVAAELMKNAATHGSAAGAPYHVILADAGAALTLTVSGGGPGFDWQRALSRARAGLDKARASGLQIVLALATELRFDDGGRTATVSLAKQCGAARS